LAADPVPLSTAGDFAILAKSGISTVPASDVTGNIGVSPIAAAAMTGFSLVLDSSVFHVDADHGQGLRGRLQEFLESKDTR
jgi:hypothetical protein